MLTTIESAMGDSAWIGFRSMQGAKVIDDYEREMRKSCGSTLVDMLKCIINN